MPSTVLGSGDTALSVIRSQHRGAPCLVEEREKQFKKKKPSAVPAQPEAEGHLQRR